jgi:glycosyltransferase involved in cell wall biosynthesis
MYEGASVAVVVPCYNEETQIGKVLETMPDLVDCVIVVDDGSADRTAEVARRHADGDGAGRVVLLEHDKNEGVGAAIVSGYREAVRRRMDVTAVMAGDGQMDPEELHLVVGPVVRGEADYAKGNRLFYPGAWRAVPRARYLGNAFLSMLTKIASGYWHVADSQSGYTAIALRALQMIDLDGVYRSYGYPNDILVRLNVFDMRVKDVPVRPVYDVGERSKMRLCKVIPTMTWLILKRFAWRLWHKYVIRDFHPLVLFYLAGFVLLLAAAGLGARMLWVWAETGRIPPINALMWGFCTVTALQFALFAMWFDMEQNKDLK